MNINANALVKITYSSPEERDRKIEELRTNLANIAREHGGTAEIVIRQMPVSRSLRRNPFLQR